MPGKSINSYYKSVIIENATATTLAIAAAIAIAKWVEMDRI
jgi:hypothetical protein